MSANLHSWTRENLAQLGKTSDLLLAKSMGIPAKLVTAKRVSLEIPPATRESRKRVWTRNELDMLGKMSDAIVAEVIGVSRHAVTSMRNKQGIAAHISTGKRYHWTAKNIALLGTRTDCSLAKRLGVTDTVVAHKRNELGVPVFRPKHLVPRPWKRRDSWTKSEIALLGTMTDQKVAEKLGLGMQTVALKRAELSIPPASRKKIITRAVPNRPVRIIKTTPSR